MSKFILATFFTISAMMFTGCGSSTETAKTNSTTETKPAANTAPTNTATTAPKETAVADKIGVAECDEYVEKYQACVFSKVPEAYRATYKASFDQLKDGWKKSAANPQSKAALATGCKQALDTAKQSLAAYGCQW